MTRRDRLVDAGIPAMATVLSVADLPGDLPRVWSLLRVEVDGEEPYETEHVAAGTVATAAEQGARFRVLVDPGDPRRVAHANPRPVAAGPRTPRLARQLRELAAARREGRLTDEEFAARVDEALARRGLG